MRGLRLAFSIALLLGGLFSPVAAEAQQAAKAARIGYLAGNLTVNNAWHWKADGGTNGAFVSIRA